MTNRHLRDAIVADSFKTRLNGFMFQKKPASNRALLLKNCSRIHTCFMRFDLKIIYLDNNFNELQTEIIKPWRMGKRIKGTKHILEIPQ